MPHIYAIIVQKYRVTHQDGKKPPIDMEVWEVPASVRPRQDVGISKI